MCNIIYCSFITAWPLQGLLNKLKSSSVCSAFQRLLKVKITHLLLSSPTCLLCQCTAFGQVFSSGCIMIPAQSTVPFSWTKHKLSNSRVGFLLAQRYLKLSFYWKSFFFLPSNNSLLYVCMFTEWSIVYPM